jgi:hypothetical protein
MIQPSDYHLQHDAHAMPGSSHTLLPVNYSISSIISCILKDSGRPQQMPDTLHYPQGLSVKLP